MKRIFVLLFISMFLFSCKSTPNEAPAEPQKAAEPTPVVDEKKQDVAPVVKEAKDTIESLLADAQSYVVKERDTLTSIAKSFYGKDNGYYFPVIMLASSTKQKISDPDLIEPGTELLIPNLDKVLKSSIAAEILKPAFKDASDIYSRKTTKYAKDTYDGLTTIYNSL